MCMSSDQDLKQSNHQSYSSTQEDTTMPPRRSSGIETNYDETSGSDSEYSPPSSPNLSSSKRRKTGPRPRHPHIVTKHNYHDHAADPVEDDFVAAENGKTPHPCNGKGGVVVAFPVKLYEMLQQVEEEGLDHVVSWQPHGRCFVVHEPKTFKELLPKYFKLSKIASFQRQLNLYGFQRLTVGPDKNGYYNELFLRGRPDLTRKIQRVKVKGTGVRAKSNPAEEPNLYNYPAVDKVAATTANNPPPMPAPPLKKSTPSTNKRASTEKKPRKTNKLPDFPSLPQALPIKQVVPLEYQSTAVKVESMDWEKTPCKQHSSPNVATFMMDERNNECTRINTTKIPSTSSPDVKGEINFDKLIDEMFRHDQSLDFADLLKLAAV